MNGTNDTNVIVHGTGTATDPYTVNFRVTAQSHAWHWTFHEIVILVCLAAVAGFLLGFYCGKRQKQSGRSVSRETDPGKSPETS
jgi:hypothetical protein